MSSLKRNQEGEAESERSISRSFGIETNFHRLLERDRDERERQNTRLTRVLKRRFFCRLIKRRLFPLMCNFFIFLIKITLSNPLSDSDNYALSALILIKIVLEKWFRL